MMKNKKFLLRSEEKHHDENAIAYSNRRMTDYIWEVPEELFLLRTEYFKAAKLIVDMGCGPAISVVRLLKNILSRQVKYIGVDISKKMLKQAKLNIPSGEFIHADIENVKLNYRSVDVILSLGALHHALNKEKTIRNWVKSLKPGGYILLREPTFEALQRGQGESPAEEGIKVSELVSILSFSGAEVINLTYFSSLGFHLFNRFMIKTGLGKWREYKYLWYPIVVFEVVMGKLFYQRGIFRGLAFTLVARKI